MRRSVLHLDCTGVADVPYANLPLVAAGCHNTMSEPDATGGCQRQTDATEGCHSKPSQQDAIAECHSTMSHKTVTAAGRSNIAARYVVHVAGCHSNDLQHSVTEGCQGNR